MRQTKWLRKKGPNPSKFIAPLQEEFISLPAVPTVVCSVQNRNRRNRRIQDRLTSHMPHGRGAQRPRGYAHYSCLHPLPDPLALGQ